MNISEPLGYQEGFNLRILGLLICIFILSAVCLAEEKEYFDWKGSKLLASRNYTGALVYFDKATNQDPKFVDAWVHKGDTEMAMRDYNGSLKSYNEAVKIQSNKTSAWSGLTNAYSALNDYAKASTATAKMTELDPKNKAIGSRKAISCS